MNQIDNITALTPGEPVAWMHPSGEGYDSAFRDHRTVVACTGNKWEGWIPLYTEPEAPHPQREQEPMTPREIAAFVGTHEFGPDQLKWFRLGESVHAQRKRARVSGPPRPPEHMMGRADDTALLKRCLEALTASRNLLVIDLNVVIEQGWDDGIARKEAALSKHDEAIAALKERLK
jgi:hypothetical protein